MEGVNESRHRTLDVHPGVNLPETQRNLDAGGARPNAFYTQGA